MGSAKTIVITGASGGIGCELARQYARTGVVLGLIGRDFARLEPLAQVCRSLGAEVLCGAVDIRDREGLRRWLEEFDARHPVDLLIVNAGVTCGLGPGKSRETDEEADRLCDINYRGTVNTVSSLVEHMRARKSGRIVLIASLAGMRALPDMPSYSATKAAVIAYGHSLRGWLRPFGVSVTIICPGFVTSPMSARHHGNKPFEISAEKAAVKIRRAIATRRNFYAFPFILAAGVYAQRFLPPRISDWFMKSYAAEVEEDPRYRTKT